MSAWTQSLKDAFTSAKDLLAHLDLAEHPALKPDLSPDFAVRVPRPFVERMRPGDPSDPLLRQVLSIKAERLETPGFQVDPLDEQAPVIPGVLHKYASRVLLIVRGGCAINCRYCFRRHFPYDRLTLTAQSIDQALSYVAKTPEVNEVILSGGDPLMADDVALANLLPRFASISHVTRVRIHTRLPVVIPARVTSPLLDLLQEIPVPVVMVLHINHAQEIDASVVEAISRLRSAGAWVLNQAVLLRDVNDSIEAQTALAERLFAAGALPYYLNVLDRVQGAGHFAVSVDTISAIEQGLAQRLPGFLVPRVVREVAGYGHKLDWKDAPQT